MLKNKSGLIFLMFLVFSFALVQNIQAQTEDAEYENDYKKWLRSDLKAADTVAYVNVKEAKLVDQIGSGDCKAGTGGGYCLYLLTADVKEVFKGDGRAKTLEFHTVTETGYQEKNFLREEIVFLVESENEKTKKKSLGTIENSSRPVEMLAAMRAIADPKTPIDDADETDPYSLASLQAAFAEADVVVYADVTDFRKKEEDAEPFAPQDYVLQTKIAEVFKGDLKANEKQEYFDDHLYRPFRKEDLGKQVVFLQKETEGDQVFYTKIRNTADFVRNELLEKLRKIAAQKSSAKSAGVQK